MTYILKWFVLFFAKVFNKKATCRNRTGDPRITNALLYQLSQGGKNLAVLIDSI
jgi:hypothetical protein